MKISTKPWLFLGFCLVFQLGQAAELPWGFFSHKRINRLAVFTLPPEMLKFYKFYLEYITENAANPDQRRYAVEGEAPRHFIDIDVYDHFYNDSAVYKIPRYWKQAVEAHTEDTLQAYGIVPWYIQTMKYRLTEAFQRRDTKEILRLSADLGHYIGDANVPLHTTENYNGQLSNQIGIHGFWESRLPELFSDTYDFFVGPATYLQNPQMEAWQAVINAHLALDSVLRFERELTQRFPPDKKYTIDERLGQNIQTYSRDFSRAYHEMLAGQVERRMRASIKMVGDFWYTCWVDAGQPDLEALLDKKVTEEIEKELEAERQEWQKKKVKARPHESFAPPANCCHQNPYLAYYQKKIRSQRP
ncbi:MAG: hypothetical protein OHK0053_00380 [Microscillaceae bacterium]